MRSFACAACNSASYTQGTTGDLFAGARVRPPRRPLFRRTSGPASAKPCYDFSGQLRLFSLPSRLALLLLFLPSNTQPCFHQTPNSALSQHHINTTPAHTPHHFVVQDAAGVRRALNPPLEGWAPLPVPPVRSLLFEIFNLNLRRLCCYYCSLSALLG